MTLSGNNDIELARDFYGYAGAGPLTVSLSVDDAGAPESVHVGWGDAGMYLTEYDARALARFLEHVAAELRAAG